MTRVTLRKRFGVYKITDLSRRAADISQYIWEIAIWLDERGSTGAMFTRNGDVYIDERGVTRHVMDVDFQDRSLALLFKLTFA